MLYGGDVTIAATDFGCNVLKPAMQSIWITFGTRSILLEPCIIRTLPLFAFSFLFFVHFDGSGVISCLSLLTILSCIASGSSAISAAALTETVPARAASLRLSDPFSKRFRFLIWCRVMCWRSSRAHRGFRLLQTFRRILLNVCSSSLILFCFRGDQRPSVSVPTPIVRSWINAPPQLIYDDQISASMRSLTPSMMSILYGMLCFSQTRIGGVRPKVEGYRRHSIH